MWRSVRRAKISQTDRDLFERYGESVIAQVLAQISSPAQDLAGVPFDKREAARDWLTERGDLEARRERWDLLLELVIIVLIGLEIYLGLSEGAKQAAILNQMNSSISTTATILRALQTTQEQSLAELNKQLAILQDQEQGRLAALQRKPRLLIFAGGADLMNHAEKPKPCLPMPGRGEIAGCSIRIENHGELAFTNGRLRVWDAAEAGARGGEAGASQKDGRGGQVPRAGQASSGRNEFLARVRPRSVSGFYGRCIHRVHEKAVSDKMQHSSKSANPDDCGFPR
jgi:hypothetical protein